LADYKLPSIVEIKWMTANIFFSELTQSGGLKKYASLVPRRVAADLGFKISDDEVRRKYHATEPRGDEVRRLAEYAKQFGVET